MCDFQESGDEDDKTKILKLLPKKSQTVTQAHMCNYCNYTSPKRFVEHFNELDLINKVCLKKWGPTNINYCETKKLNCFLKPPCSIMLFNSKLTK